MIHSIEAHQRIQKPPENRLSHHLALAPCSITATPPLQIKRSYPKTPCIGGASATKCLKMNATEKANLPFRGALKSKFLLSVNQPTWAARLRRVVVAPLLLWLLLVLPVAVQAQYNYTTNNNQITITGYTGPDSGVVIPDTINGLLVTKIGDGAFFGRTSLTSVTIPDSVTTLEAGAFYDCSGLTSVTIGNSVTSIGYEAFTGCSGLTSVTIPDSVTIIGTSAFFSCSGLTSVTIPNSVTTLGADAFYACTRLTSVTIGNSVTVIGSQAFSHCRSLTSVTIPNSVTSIGYEAFYGCSGLTSITIGNRVTIIGTSAFFSCSGLTRVTIPDSVTTLGDFACEKCTGLTSVTIGSSVTSLGDGAFGGCTGLTNLSVDVSNPVYSSLSGALFDKAQAMLVLFPAGQGGSYTIPNSVTRIGDDAFAGCSGLTDVTIGNSVTNIGYEAFYGCSGLTSVTIGNRVNTIGDYTFQACIGLTRVTIGSSVNTIVNNVFEECSGLKGVYFQGNAPSVTLLTFVFADNAVIYYLPGTTGWGATFGGRPAVLWNSLIQTGDASFGVKAGQFGFKVTGTTGLSFVVEATTDLAHPVWSPLSTNTLAGGTATFSDPQWKSYPSRLYRLRTP